MDKISISVVMPALNEEASIRDAISSTLRAFKDLSLEGEIIVVNDGSTDKTREIVENLMQQYSDSIRLLNHASSMGMGKSFWDGAFCANKQAVTLLPGDNENNPQEILRYTDLLNNVDMVVPFVVNRNVRALSRNILSRLFSFIINLTFCTSFKYTNGTIIYRRSILHDIACKSPGFFFQAETLIKAAKLGYLFAEVPYYLSMRSAGVSKAVSLGSLCKVMGGYLGLVKDIYFSKKYTFNKNKLKEDSQAFKRSSNV